ITRVRIERTSERARLETAESNSALYAMLVACCLVEGDVDAAYEYTSAAKGRTFADLLGSSRFDVSSVSPEQDELYSDLEPYISLQQRIDQIERYFFRNFTLSTDDEHTLPEHISPISLINELEVLRA